MSRNLLAEIEQIKATWFQTLSCFLTNQTFSVHPVWLSCCL